MLNDLPKTEGDTPEALSQLTGISMSDLAALKKGRKVTKHNIEAICQVLNCQPSDIIEFTKSETKGHWEWVADKEE